MKVKNLLLAGLALVMVLSVSGCLFSPDDDGTDPGPGTDPVLVYPSNPDKLMQNFETIYTEMLIDAFEAMLHVDYKTILLQSTMDEWAGGDDPLTESYFTRDDEVRIHRNIFSGNTGVGPAGEPIPPVSSIDVDYLDKEGTWEPIPASDPDFGGLNGYYATFDVLLYFNNPDNHRYEISQKVEFFVASVQDGDREKWQLLGQRGQSN